MTSRTQSQAGLSEEAVFGFLAEQPGLGGRLVAVEFDTARRKSGASSGTQLLDAHIETDSGARLRRGLVFRYDLGGTFFFQYDLISQFKILRALEHSATPVPKALWLDAEGVIAGRPGMFMAQVDAAAPAGQPLAEGPIASATPADRHAMILSSIGCFADLNNVDFGSLRLDFLETRGSGANFIARALNWDRAELLHAIPSGFGGDRKAYYNHVRTVMLAVADHLLALAPLQRKPELVHGDTNLSNLMFRGTNVEALLDWELCHIGLGEADLGYCEAGIDHFRTGLPPIEGIPNENEMLAVYRARKGRADDVEYCRLWGEWRLGVYQVMAYSRFPDSMRDVEEMYWKKIETNLRQFLPSLG